MLGHGNRPLAGGRSQGASAGHGLARCAAFALAGWAVLAAPSCRREAAEKASPQAPNALPGSLRPPLEDVRPPAEFDPGLPKIDVHLHISPAATGDALRMLEQAGIRVGLNASGGAPGPSLARSLAIAETTSGRIRPLCNVDLARAGSSGAEAETRAFVRACKSGGALGLKIHKGLGLGLFDRSGALVPVDSPLLDALFDEAGVQGLPVLIHSGDPRAFFRAPTPENERFEELSAHPGWSFFGRTPTGRPWPSWEEVLDAFERRVARHPQTRFVGAHFGNAAEEPERVARMLDSYPNYFIDTAARVPEFGRHESTRMREFFVRYQERILFGSDLSVMPGGVVLGSGGRELDSADGAPEFFRAHWRYFEGQARGLAHPTPIQGRWKIDAISLPRAVLEKLYWRNAARVFALQLSTDAGDRLGN
jgi:predicted TIM-barrel fold metal-dependent hydrolase